MGSLKPQILCFCAPRRLVSSARKLGLRFLAFAHLADSLARLASSPSGKVSEKAKGFALLNQIIAGDGAARAKAGGNGLPLAKIARPADQRSASSAVHSKVRGRIYSNIRCGNLAVTKP